MSNGDITTTGSPDLTLDEAFEIVEREVQDLGLPSETSLEHVEHFLRLYTGTMDAMARLKIQYGVMRRQMEYRLRCLTISLGTKVEGHVHDLVCDGAKKSIDTLYGRAGFRKSQGKVEVVDDMAFIDWLHEQDIQIKERMTECIRTIVAKKSPIGDYIRDTGEVPPGIRYTEPGVNFYPATHPTREERNGEETRRTIGEG